MSGLGVQTHTQESRGIPLGIGGINTTQGAKSLPLFCAGRNSNLHNLATMNYK